MALTSTHTLSCHAREQMTERGIQPDEIAAVLGNRRREVYRSHPGIYETWRYRHVDRGLVVVTEGSVVITVFRCNERVTQPA